MNDSSSTSEPNEPLSGITQDFAKTLKKIRSEKNFTQHVLADNSGLSLRFISDLERGLRQPTLITLFKLANAFEMSISELTERLLKEIQSK